MVKRMPPGVRATLERLRDRASEGSRVRRAADRLLLDDDLMRRERIPEWRRLQRAVLRWCHIGTLEPYVTTREVHAALRARFSLLEVRSALVTLAALGKIKAIGRGRGRTYRAVRS